MEKKNEKYSTEYAPYEFVVDTDYGSTLVQNLINLQAVSSIVDKLGINDMESYDKVSNIYEYVVSKYAFAMDPSNWPTVQETVRAKRGDCKSLSLLLMSLLISAGVNAHAALSNGHMWVNVFYDNKWHVLEVDRDPGRNKIYSIPGFYEDPLYKIFIDRTEKRKILKGFQRFFGKFIDSSTTEPRNLLSS
jgi:hypothetical protein